MASCTGSISICYVHEDFFFQEQLTYIFACTLYTYRKSRAESGKQEQVNMHKSKAMKKPIDV